MVSLKDFLVIKDPQVAKLFADPTRRGILHNLRHQEMPPFKLAKILDKNVSSITYHLEALERAGLVEMSRTGVRGNLIEKFYSAKARMFVISYTLSEGLVPESEDIAKWTKEICRSAANNLPAFGHKVPAEKVDGLADLIEQHASLERAAHEEVIAKQTSPTNLEQPALKLLLNLLTHVNLYNDPRYIEVIEEISRELGKPEGKWSKVGRGVPS